MQPQVKPTLTYFSASPNHFEPREDGPTEMKFAPDSEATAFASMVLPVPGGPNNSTPLVGFVNWPRMNSSGLFNGSITTYTTEPHHLYTWNCMKHAAAWMYP